MLDSKVEPVVADFTLIDLDELGQFDITLYLGVLYHMKEPLTCLERVRQVTRQVAVIETEAVHLQGFDDQPVMYFQAGSDVGADYGNWYVPSITAIHALCRAAGFGRVETVAGPPPPPPPVVPTGPDGVRSRLANRLTPPVSVPEPSAPTSNYRAVVHAFV